MVQESNREKPVICFVAPWIYPLFNPEFKTHFGGWEVRVSAIARELALRGNFEVRVVTADHGQPHIEEREGILFYSWLGREIWDIPRQPEETGRFSKIWKSFRNRFLPSPLKGQIGSYVITPEMVEIYDEVDADIYTVPGNSQFSGELAFYCQQRGKRYIFLAGSDMDCYPEYKTEPDKNDMYSVPHRLKTYALENNVLRIMQNERQIEMLRDGYGLDGVIVRNPIDLTPKYPRPDKPESILWIGRSEETIKRPSLVYELARRLPEIPFVIVLNKSIPEIHEQRLKEAESIPNITLFERVPFEESERYYAAARVFVNTSVFEGFPNTFLFAAKYGVPIVATDIDPGGMLSKHRCGITCDGDFELFVSSVKRLFADQAYYNQVSQGALDYVRTWHDKHIVISQYEDYFRQVLHS